MSEIRNAQLWEKGKIKIDWVKRHMPLLSAVREDFIKEKPFRGKKVALSVHLEAKTAFLCLTLASGGAEMFVTGSNPLSTQDDIAAALAREGLNVFAWHGATREEYERHTSSVIKAGPNIIIDDGGDLVNLIHMGYPEKLGDVIGGCEETTTGIIRLKAMDRAGELKFPMVLVNNAKCKYLFDNRYGTGQSVWDGITRTTNLIVAGKTVVVAGYGWCGKGVAMRAKGLGARVIVTEIDPIKAIEAVMDGFEVMEMTKAASRGDFFVTVTGCRDVISKEAFRHIKDKAILCNAGHFDVEVDVKSLAAMAKRTFTARENITGYEFDDGRTVYLLGEGRLVNLACGDGHPAEIMDMSFALQALSAAYLVKNGGSLKGVLEVPEEIDISVAKKQLGFWGVSIDSLTPDQADYLNSWQF